MSDYEEYMKRKASYDEKLQFQIDNNKCDDNVFENIYKDIDNSTAFFFYGSMTLND